MKQSCDDDVDMTGWTAIYLNSGTEEPADKDDVIARWEKGSYSIRKGNDLFGNLMYSPFVRNYHLSMFTSLVDAKNYFDERADMLFSPKADGWVRPVVFEVM
jgi:hypothetical protein